MSQSLVKPRNGRPLHFSNGMKPTTFCGKQAIRCRNADTVREWDRMKEAWPRACPACAAEVARIRPRAHGGA